MRSHAELVHAARCTAMQLVSEVRDDDPARNGRYLRALMRSDPDLLVAVTITLAAACPEDRPFSQLLAWTDHLEVA